MLPLSLGAGCADGNFRRVAHAQHKPSGGGRDRGSDCGRMPENFLTHANNEQRRWQKQELEKEEREEQFQRISIVDSVRTRVFIVREALA